MHSSARRAAPRGQPPSRKSFTPDSPIQWKDSPGMGVAVALLLAAIAWFGHAFLLTAWLNVWFSLPLRRRFLKWMRLAVAFTVFAFPLAWAWIYGQELLSAWDD